MKNRITLLLFVTIIALLNTSSIFARQITYNEVISVSNNKLIELKKADIIYVNNCVEIKTNSIIAFVVNLNPKGYIVVSANTDLPPIIAYSFESNFGELNESNPLFSIIISDLTNRNKYFSQSNIVRNNSKWEELLNENYKLLPDETLQQWPDVGDGWLKTNWTQNAPYSDFCPMDPVTNVRSIAGCPSTAMAQILNFHATTNNTQFNDFDDYYHNYAGRQYWIDNDYLARDFPSFPELNVYLDTLEQHYLNNILPTNEDKAALTFACGIAATQVYTSAGSGTFGVNQAYEAYMRFNCTTASLLDTTNLDLYDRLMQNMKDTLPAHLAIVNPTWTSGHNVVVDGYNTDNYYHLNFGWGGSYNSWYLLPQEIPYNLTVIEGVIVDIMKKENTSIFESDIINSNISVFPNPFSESTIISYNLTNNTNICLYIFDITGKIIFSKQFSEEKGYNQISINLNSNPEGIYYYKLKVGNSLYTGKLIKIEGK
ncbi:MAG: C10 family peptidase [Bacteroidia bacterium]|nr:C10 family peptidase [Bacteroidia bacterium]